MRIVFMGTPDFAVPSLQALIDAGHDVCAVYTQPDKPQGRKQILTAPPVKTLALAHDIPVFQPNTLKNEDEQARLRELAPEVIIVVAYGKLLPKAVLDIPPHGCINVHGSLLPRWRGAAPIQRAILAGDERAGISIMRIGHGVDTGAYCAQASCSVAGKTADELTAELAQLGADLLCDTLPALADGTAVWIEQDESLVTHAQKISKAEMRLDPQEGALVNLRRVLASSDAAPARCIAAGKPVRIMRAVAADGDASMCAAGELVCQSKRIYIGCSDGVLEVMSVKPDDKRQMDASAWAAGLHGDGLTWGKLS